MAARIKGLTNQKVQNNMKYGGQLEVIIGEGGDLNFQFRHDNSW
jgi:hypothetical protein